MSKGRLKITNEDEIRECIKAIASFIGDLRHNDAMSGINSIKKIIENIGELNPQEMVPEVAAKFKMEIEALWELKRKLEAIVVKM